MDKQNDETIKQILQDDAFEVKNGKKKNNCLVRFLLFIVLILVIVLGFIFIQQFLLNIEAEAIVRAARTATASGLTSSEKIIDKEPIPTETPLSNAEVVRTATIAVQLTNIAEFQQTKTKEP